MLHSTNETFERLKQDLIEKEHLLEEKNREILRLRMDYKEAVLTRKTNKREADKKAQLTSE